MTPLDARVAQVVAQLGRDWRQVGRQLERAGSVDPAASVANAALVALSLDHAYQAFETLLLRTERAVGLPERVGQHWHVQLLADAGSPLSGARPAVYPTTVRHHWEVLLRFRHFLRHAYAVELDPGELVRTHDHLRRAVSATSPSIASLIAELTAGIGTTEA